MFCENCGKQLKDTDKFCMQCGCRVVNEEPVGEQESAPAYYEAPMYETSAYEAPIYQAPVYENESVQENAKGKNKFKKNGGSGNKLGIIIPIIAVFVVVLAIVAFNFKVLANFALRTFTSPENYYHYVEKKAFAENAETIAALYENHFLAGLNTEDQGVEGKMALKLGDSTVDLLESLAGASIGMDDLSWLQEISVITNGGKKDSVCQGQATLVLGETEIVSGEVIMDMEEGTIYLGFPGLLDKYAKIELPEDSYEMEEFKESIKMMEELYEKAPDKKAVEKLLYRYFCIAIEEIEKVDKKSEELEVEDISKKYTRLKVTFDEETVLEMAEAVMKEMKSDEELEKIILDVASVQEDIDAEDFYDEFREEIKTGLEQIDEAKDRLKDYESDSKYVMLVYVDGKGNICGREFKEQEGKEVISSFGYRMPQKGNDFGFEFFAESMESTVELTGSGNRSGDMLNGEFTGKVDDVEMFTAEVTDYNTAEIKNGYLNGNFVLSLSEDADPSGTIPNISEYKMELDIHTTAEASEATIIVNDGEDELFAFESTFNKTKDSGADIPSKENVVVVEDESDMQELLLEVDFVKLIDSLREAGLPSNITDGMEFFLSLM